MSGGLFGEGHEKDDWDIRRLDETGSATDSPEK